MSPATAVKECYQEFFHFGFAKLPIKPRVIVGFRFKVHALLDLTQVKIRRKLGFSLKELLEEDWLSIQDMGAESWTQAIGRGAFIAGFEGLLAPSAQDNQGCNVVLFPSKLSKSSTIEIMAKEELPPHPNAS